MPIDLILRRTNSRFTPEWDRDKFWTVFHQDLRVGVVLEHRLRSDEPVVWDWIVQIQAGRFANGIRHEMAIEGREATRDACLAPFRSAFIRYLAFIGEEGWALHVKNSQSVREDCRLPSE